ncbi:MAG TPA: hypothetical protein VMU62_03630, partial [Acidobacteriaceae bacterium]|nr:hypothetical protein [Acidobacteriaceae bacterium]
MYTSACLRRFRRGRISAGISITSEIVWLALLSVLIFSTGVARAQSSTPDSGTARHHNTKKTSRHTAKHPTKHTSHSATHKTSTRHTRTKTKAKSRHNIARVHQLRQAFVASSQLRPMAQQLSALRTPAAYAGVERYAHTHSGEAAGAAYLALGNAYLADRRYPEATAAFLHAHQSGQALADYADYLGAKAHFAQLQYTQAETLLSEFATRHPDSILIDRAQLLLAQSYIAEGDPQNALKQLTLLENTTE